MIRPVGAAVLAAGGSTRMGACKALLRLDGETLLGRSIRVAREGGCSPVVVVAGSNFEGVAAEAETRGAVPVMNSVWSEGMGASISAGVSRLDNDRSIRAVLLLACDQPLVGGNDVSRIVTAFRDSAAPIVVSDYGNGSFGIPALFAREHFPGLLSLRGDRGAKTLIERERTRAIFVAAAAAAIDVDTPGEWERLRTRFRPCECRTPAGPRGRRRSSNRPAQP